MCHQQPTVLPLLDISVIFITIDGSILIDHITGDFDITRNALRWLQSFPTGCSQYVGVSYAQSVILQGSVGPLFFAMYILPVANIVTGHNLHQRQYADNTQALYGC